MNEQIRAIWNEAAQQESDTTWEGQVRFMDCFAKLIIEKCASICNCIYFDNYPDAELYERSAEGEAIKKHFGVE